MTIAMLRPLALAVLLAFTQAASAQLPAPVSQLLFDANIPEDAMSALVLRGDTALLSHQAERPLNPASTMKVLTTMVALDQLGPAFRGRTELRTGAMVSGDVLRGDLVLRGGADADFSGEALERMLQSLRNQGIRKIDGRLVLDRQLFNPARPDIGAPQFDESPEAYTNVIPDALMVNKNMLELDLRSTGGKVTVAAWPELDGVTISSAMTLVDADCGSWANGWKQPDVQRDRLGKITVLLKGSFPAFCAKSYRVNVLDRQDYLDRLFRATWKRLGGVLAGDTIEAATPAATRLLAEHVSRTLPDIVRDYNKSSDNTLARTVFLTLGSLEADPVVGSRALATIPGETTVARAERTVRDWMRANGIDDTGLVLENGSGLSRIERISAVQMGGVLQAGLRSNWSPELMSSLPIAALDGTLRKRLGDSPAAQRARLKTGTLRNVVAVAGYVRDATGQQCVVVAMINSELIGNGKGRAVLDALVDWVARSGVAPVQLP
ncbi:D-alanyl-D-alanine carboxypeptidase/D-alanyl-D-alanine-endopeptidase [Massilia sp. H27-R4]|nr:D-alanyl-D-alanine carboxypeptidase/D-alanyl-D-alanine-endopeptidase [Massilia sp. H27-R4]